MTKAYDEARALRFYLFHSCLDLLTPEERCVVQDAMLGRYVLMRREGGEPRMAVLVGPRLHDPAFANLDEQAIDGREIW